MADVDVIDNPITVSNGRFNLIGKYPPCTSIVTDGKEVFGIRTLISETFELKSKKRKDTTEDYKCIKSEEYLCADDEIPIFLHIDSELIVKKVCIDDIEIIDYQGFVIGGKYKQIGICAEFPILTDGDKVFGVTKIFEWEMVK